MSERNRYQMIPSIPPRTRAELANPASSGSRHEQAVGVAISLIKGGLVPNAVFEQLRSMYTEDVTDDEIMEIIRWAVKVVEKQPQSYEDAATRKARTPGRNSMRPRSLQGKVSREVAIANTERWLKGFRCNVTDLRDKSPLPPLDDWRYDSLWFFTRLYGSDEFINIVTDYTIERNEEGDGAPRHTV